MNELIELVFAARNAAHLEHWKTKSYAAHIALSDFYDGIIDSIDALVEARQGVGTLVKVGALKKQEPCTDIIGHLSDDLVWIKDNRKAITNGVPALDNLLQDLEAVYMSTLYKLRNLS